MLRGGIGCGEGTRKEFTVQNLTIIETSETGLPKPSTDDLDLTTLPERLDDETLALVEAIAQAPLPELPPCDGISLSQALRTMLAVLPRRNADDLSGELFVAAYDRALSRYPAEQVEFIRDVAIDRCKWFPTVAECHELATEWRRNDAATKRRSLALSAVYAERRARSPIAEHVTRERWQPEPGETARILREAGAAIDAKRSR